MVFSKMEEVQMLLVDSLSSISRRAWKKGKHTLHPADSRHVG
jgi:hypothetical protein